jgi:hypothetical protein
MLCIYSVEVFCIDTLVRVSDNKPESIMLSGVGVLC